MPIATTRRSSQAVIRMFKEQPDGLSICFHGNNPRPAPDSPRTDVRFLEFAILTTAKKRVKGQPATGSGFPWDEVMMLLQGCFSEEAMSVVNAHNFKGAIKTSRHILRASAALHTIGDLLHPSIWKSSIFPLFLKKYNPGAPAQDVTSERFHQQIPFS